MRIALAFVVCAVSGVSLAQDGLSADEFEATPAFVETFAGGQTVGQWEMDPANLGGATQPTLVTSTPTGVAPTVTALDPVASSVDSGVLAQGNPVATNGSLFGLNYYRCINSLADGSGINFLDTATFNKYRIVARQYFYSDTDQPERWQVGVYCFGGGDLFRTAVFYNTNSLGNGPGFGWRGSTANGIIPGTAALSTSRWTLVSLMVDATDPDPALHRLAICVDANGDEFLDENDPLEYMALTLDAANRPPDTFGLWSVGEVNSDGFPLFTDTVEVYLPAVSSVLDWTVY